MIFPPDNPVLDLPAKGVAHLTVVHVRNPKGHIRRGTAMMRTSPTELRAWADKNPKLRGIPSYWCERDDGKVEVWPAPADQIDIEATNAYGQCIDRQTQRPAMLVAPVSGMVEELNKAHVTNLQVLSGPTKVEIVDRFGDGR